MLIIIAWMCSVATQALLIVGFVSVVIGVHAWEISIQQYGYYSRVCHNHFFCSSSKPLVNTANL